jgi:carbonic anhydrase/acetyltransferase-like protein (isoleucine patch superfamily)
MRKLHRFLAASAHPLARAARALYRRSARLSLPAPGWLVRPAASAVHGLRATYHAGARVLVCEPLFKGRCTQHGTNLHTGSALHWIQGLGDIIVGDDVTFDGKSTITFSSAYTDRPTLRVGHRTVIAHSATIVVGRAVTIGCDCLLAAGVCLFDSPGHPSDPEARRSGLRPSPRDVRPVVVEDNVWIGRGALVGPGVTIGQGSIVAAGAVVLNNVPPCTLVMGNPARRVLQLQDPGIHLVQSGL